MHTCRIRRARDSRMGPGRLHSTGPRLGDTRQSHMLVKHNADTMSQDKDGRTSLHLASKMSDVEVLTEFTELTEHCAVDTA